MERLRDGSKSKAARMLGAGVGFALATGTLAGCNDNANATPDNSPSIEQSVSPSPTQSAEVISSQDLLPNAEAIRATIDETNFQIPYREDYTATELATLSMDIDMNIREMFKENTELLIDDLDKYSLTHFDETGELGRENFMGVLNEVQVEIAKDNIVSSDYLDSLQPGDFNYIENTVVRSGSNTIEGERKAMSQGIEYDISGELLESSPAINYADSNNVYSRYVYYERTTALNNAAETSTALLVTTHYVVEDGLLKIKSQTVERQ